MFPGDFGGPPHGPPGHDRGRGRGMLPPFMTGSHSSKVSGLGFSMGQINGVPFGSGMPPGGQGSQGFSSHTGIVLDPGFTMGHVNGVPFGSG